MVWRKAPEAAVSVGDPGDEKLAGPDAQCPGGFASAPGTHQLQPGHNVLAVERLARIKQLGHRPANYGEQRVGVVVFIPQGTSFRVYESPVYTFRMLRESPRLRGCGPGNMYSSGQV